MSTQQRQPEVQRPFQWYTLANMDEWHAVAQRTEPSLLAYRTLCSIQRQEGDAAVVKRNPPAEDAICPECGYRYLQLGNPQCFDASCTHYFTSHAASSRAACLVTGCHCTRYRTTKELERAVVRHLANEVALRTVEPNDRERHLDSPHDFDLQREATLALPLHFEDATTPLGTVVLLQRYSHLRLVHEECAGGQGDFLGRLAYPDGALGNKQCVGCGQYLEPHPEPLPGPVITTEDVAQLMAMHMNGESGYDGPPWPQPHAYQGIKLNASYEHCGVCHQRQGAPWHVGPEVKRDSSNA